VALPLAALALLATLAGALTRGLRTRFDNRRGGERRRLQALTASLTAAQPLARMAGRIDYGLAPWSRGRTSGFLVPRPRETRKWCEDWREPAQRVSDVERELGDRDVVVERGGAFDRWDLQARGGLFGSARLRFAVEDHGAGTQLVRARVSPWWPGWCTVLLVAITILCGLALADGATVAGAILGVAAGIWGVVMLRESGGALAAVVDALGGQGDHETGEDPVDDPEEHPEQLIHRPADG
jgi:hypothetical protein